MGLHRRHLGIALAALIALVLAACGGGGGESASTTPDGGTAVLASAADQTRSAGSSKVAFTLVTDLPKAIAEKPLTFTGSGEFDYENRTGAVTYDFSELFQSLGQNADDPVEMRFIGDVFYMKFPLITNFLPTAGPWLEFDLKTLSQEGGIDLSQLQQLGQSDPSQALDYLRATGSVETVGTEEIDGVETTHFKGTIELDKVVEQVPAAQQEQVRKAIDQLKKQTGLTEIPTDVWVDGDGLVRKMTFAYTAKVPVSGSDPQDASTTITMEFSDFGVDVNVEAPPADQVTDLADLNALAGGTSSS